jgi:Protein of unknown function (DUF742)
MTDYQPPTDAPEELCPYLTQPYVTNAEPYVAQAETAATHRPTAVLYPRRTEAVMAGPQSEATDELCSHLTDAEEATTGPRHAKSALTASPWVRPYVVTGGRTHTRHLLVHTLVFAPDYNPSLVAQLPPEARFLYERAHTHTESVAELSAHCGIPLGVTRVLLSDLVAAGHVEVGPDPYASPYDSELLERIIDGLQQFA